MNIFISLFSSIEDPNNPNVAIPCFYETIIEDFKKSGHNLFVFVSKNFGANYENIPQELLDEIKAFKPDLFILFNNTFYDISKYFDVPIVVYEVDTPLFYSNRESLKKNISRYKFIISQEESVKTLEDMFNVNSKNILKIPFFTEVHAENLPIEQNISFIGTKFVNSQHQNIYNKFMMQNPDNEEIIQFKSIINEFLNNPLITKQEILAKVNTKSSKIIDNLDLNYLIFLLSDYNRVETLDAVADLGLRIYGTKNWITDTYNKPNLILNFINTPVYSLKHNQDIYNSSKIGININHLQACSGFSWRVCDILASNACLVSEYKSNIESFFVKANIPMFTNHYEAREICKKLINNENMRKDIVAASQEIIDSKFRYKYTKREIENFLNLDFSNINNTPSIKYKIQYAQDVVHNKNKTLQQIFSIKNSDDKKHKIISLFGAKIKVKR